MIDHDTRDFRICSPRQQGFGHNLDHLPIQRVQRVWAVQRQNT
jgi:hypothetical protein